MKKTTKKRIRRSRKRLEIILENCVDEYTRITRKEYARQQFIRIESDCGVVYFTPHKKYAQAVDMALCTMVDNIFSNIT
jgi:hypothetical protein